MRHDSLYLGEVPAREPCAGIGQDDYPRRSRRECRALIGQLRRTNGPEPDGARLYVAENPHDFGTYLSVNCEFDPEDERSVAYAFRCEGEGFPQEWDDQARRELGLGDGPDDPADAAGEAGEAGEGAAAPPPPYVDAGGVAHEAQAVDLPLPAGRRPLFPLGLLYLTRGAQELLYALKLDPLDLIVRHATGDWGELPDEDRELNGRSVRRGGRVFSSYLLAPHDHAYFGQARVWVITESDRSATTVLLPSEY